MELTKCYFRLNIGDFDRSFATVATYIAHKDELLKVLKQLKLRIETESYIHDDNGCFAIDPANPWDTCNEKYRLRPTVTYVEFNVSGDYEAIYALKKQCREWLINDKT